jgi:hypothetical protein
MLFLEFGIINGSHNSVPVPELVSGHLISVPELRTVVEGFEFFDFWVVCGKGGGRKIF